MQLPAAWVVLLLALTSSGRQQSAAPVEELQRDLRAGLSSRDAAAIIASASALGERGTEAAGAIPWLWHAIELDHGEETKAVRGAAVKALRRIGHRACLRLPDAGRWLACEGWTPRRPLAESLEEWLELIEHPLEEWRSLAARELAKRHPEALESLVARLSDPDPGTRVHAAAAAGAFSRPRIPSRSGAFRVLPKPVAPLAACLDADDPRLRVQACMSLGELLPDSARVLVAATRHADPRVRREALFGLALGLDARWAVSPVPDLSLNGYAGSWSPDWPLEGSDLLRSESIDRLSGCLEDPATGNRILALTILAKIGRGTPEAVERVRRARGDAHAGVRAWAEYTLRRMDPGDSLGDRGSAGRTRCARPLDPRAGRERRRAGAGARHSPELEAESGTWGSSFLPRARAARATRPRSSSRAGTRARTRPACWRSSRVTCAR